MVTEELRIRRDLIQEDLRHLQWALQQRGSGKWRNKNKLKETKKEKAKTRAEKGKTALIQTGET